MFLVSFSLASGNFSREHGIMQAGMVAESSTSGSAGNRKRELLGLVWAFETSKSIPSNILSPIRPHIIIPLK